LATAVTCAATCRTGPCRRLLYYLADWDPPAALLAAKASPSTEAGLQPGDLVEFERDNKAVLGLVTQADGKAKHFVMDQ
ncbi:hypothetical protein HaLaN_26037, partial [Haematococcus lacustris]